MVKQLIIILFVLLITLGITICLSTGFGAVSINPITTMKILTAQFLRFPWQMNWSMTEQTIILDVRLPRILVALLAGFALASAGVIFQALLRNPLADPFVIGVSSGAAVGAVIAMALPLPSSWLGLSTLPIFSFLGGLGTIVIIFAIAQSNGRLHSITLLLAGVIVNAFFSAIIMVLASVIEADNIQRFILWMMGHLDIVDPKLLFVVSLFLLFGWIILWVYSRHLNVLSLGDESAMQLGIDVERTKRIVFIAAAIIAGAVVSISGIIGFIGLMIPHIVRSIVGSDHRILLPAAGLSGAIFLILADTIARTIIAPTEIPVGVITALTGAPFFIYILRSKKWRGF
ncbi:MAG: iron chelate uptake ABC transporter family permease subunit [bacterium]|nr:iron chelate uptake ABC transporter family permease subunit [bacterium]